MVLASVERDGMNVANVSESCQARDTNPTSFRMAWSLRSADVEGRINKLSQNRTNDREHL